MLGLRRLCSCLWPHKPATPRALSTSASDSDAIARAANAIGECKSIIVMCGAGVSVSAGIPDFRTPGT
eukprot:4094081-Prymnesium_polylepis.1